MAWAAALWLIRWLEQFLLKGPLERLELLDCCHDSWLDGGVAKSPQCERSLG